MLSCSLKHVSGQAVGGVKTNENLRDMDYETMREGKAQYVYLIDSVY